MLKTLEFKKLSSQLCLKEPGLSQKQKIVSRDCFQHFILDLMCLLTVPIVKNSGIVAGIYFIFLKERARPKSKTLQYQIWTAVRRLKI